MINRISILIFSWIIVYSTDSFLITSSPSSFHKKNKIALYKNVQLFPKTLSVDSSSSLKTTTRRRRRRIGSFILNQHHHHHHNSITPCKSFISSSSYCMSLYSTPNREDYDDYEDDEQEEEEEENEPIRMTKTTEMILKNKLKTPHSSPTTSLNNNNNTPLIQNTIYSVPALYDLASSYRNYEQEVQFLLWAQETYGQTTTTEIKKKRKKKFNILELAAGPARHSITALKYFSKQINSCTAMDTSIDMLQYAQDIVKEDEDKDTTLSFHYILDDMRFMNVLKQQQKQQYNTTSDNDYDAIWLISGSMSHLLTQEDVLHCFYSSYQVLHQGGLLILEVNHPKELFQMIECTRNTWNIPLQDSQGVDFGTIHVVWGDYSHDIMDPIRQVRNMTLSIEWKEEKEKKNKEKDDYESSSSSSSSSSFNTMTRNKMTRNNNNNKETFKKKFGIEKDGQKEEEEEEETKKKSTKTTTTTTSVYDVVPMRSFTMQEINLFAKLVGFHVVGTFGALDEELDIHNEDAFRMVCILRKDK